MKEGESIYSAKESIWWLQGRKRERGSEGWTNITDDAEAAGETRGRRGGEAETSDDDGEPSWGRGAPMRNTARSRSSLVAAAYEPMTKTRTGASPVDSAETRERERPVCAGGAAPSAAAGSCYTPSASSDPRSTARGRRPSSGCRAARSRGG